MLPPALFVAQHRVDPLEDQVLRAAAARVGDDHLMRATGRLQALVAAQLSHSCESVSRPGRQVARFAWRYAFGSTSPHNAASRIARTSSLAL